MGPGKALLKALGGLTVLILASAFILLTLVIKPAQRRLAARLGAHPPHPGLLLFLHAHTRWEDGSRRDYMALEVDIVRPCWGAMIRVDWLVLSDSGIRLYPSIVHRETGEVLLFNGKPLGGHRVVLWAPMEGSPPPTLTLYNCPGRMVRVSTRPYYGRIIKTALYQAQRACSSPWRVEVLTVEYDVHSGVEVYTINHGYGTRRRYREWYLLISDSYGL